MDALPNILSIVAVSIIFLQLLSYSFTVLPKIYTWWIWKYRRRQEEFNLIIYYLLMLSKELQAFGISNGEITNDIIFQIKKQQLKNPDTILYKVTELISKEKITINKLVLQKVMNLRNLLSALYQLENSKNSGTWDIWKNNNNSLFQQLVSDYGIFSSASQSQREFIKYDEKWVELLNYHKIGFIVKENVLFQAFWVPKKIPISRLKLYLG